MGLISRAVDRLPIWAKGILGLLAVIVTIYAIAKQGFWPVLLKAIFSPDL